MNKTLPLQHSKNTHLYPELTDPQSFPYGGVNSTPNYQKALREGVPYGGPYGNNDQCMRPMYMPQSDTMPGMNWSGIRKNTVYPEFQYGNLDKTYDSGQHIATKDILPGANNVMKRVMYNNVL